MLNIYVFMCNVSNISVVMKLHIIWAETCISETLQESERSPFDLMCISDMSACDAYMLEL